MIKITIAFSGTAGDIPTYEFKDDEVNDTSFSFIQEQLDLSDDNVFVCFKTNIGLEFDLGEDYKNEHTEFFITNDKEDAESYFYSIAEPHLILRTDNLNFNFFCFENYEEAFKYCIDLKEGL